MKKYSLVVAFFIVFVACGNESAPITVEPSAVALEEEVEVIGEAVIEVNEIDPKEEVVQVNKPKIIIIEDENSDDSEYQKVWKTPTTEGNPLAAPPQEVQEAVYTEEFKPDHKPWDEVTKKHVSSTGNVNYKGMKADLSKIATYLDHLKKTPPKKDWSKNEKLAYWINLYNASTVYLITSNYPTSSITKLNGGKPWDKKFVKSGTKTYSLNDIENVIVRPRFKDPRIHAALNCAAVSCPKLMDGAYLPSKLNAQLDKQTFAWINDATKNKLKGNKAQVSQIFDWYKADFKEGVPAFINKYIMTGLALEPKANITYLEYDWALNE